MSIQTIYLAPTLIRVSNVEEFSSKEMKYALFDLDNTLIRTKHGGKFPRSEDDWEFCPNVLDKLKQVQKSNYKIIIITNQSGISRKESRKKIILGEITSVVSKFDFEVQVYISTAVDYWRKPNTSIVERFIWNKEILKNIEKIESVFYVGDAAGRPDDFSDSDYSFAYNIYLLMKYFNPKINKSQYPKFITNTKFFENQKTPSLSDQPIRTSVDPNTYINKSSDVINDISNNISNETKPIIIIMIGAPGSGKSTMANAISKKFNIPIISQDNIANSKMSKKQYLDAINITFENSVIIDNTHPTIASRTYKYSGISYAILFSNVELAQHMNIVRERIKYQNVDPKDITYPTRIPDVVYNKYIKSFQEPTLDEFDKIFTIKNDIRPGQNTKSLMYFRQFS